MTHQPTALRLADILGEQRFAELTGNNHGKEAAEELRRLNAVEVESNLLIEGEWQRNQALCARIATLEAALEQAVAALIAQDYGQNTEVVVLATRALIPSENPQV